MILCSVYTEQTRDIGNNRRAAGTWIEEERGEKKKKQHEKKNAIVPPAKNTTSDFKNHFWIHYYYHYCYSSRSLHFSLSLSLSPSPLSLLFSSNSICNFSYFWLRAFILFSIFAALFVLWLCRRLRPKLNMFFFGKLLFFILGVQCIHWMVEFVATGSDNNMQTKISNWKSTTNYSHLIWVHKFIFEDTHT